MALLSRFFGQKVVYKMEKGPPPPLPSSEKMPFKVGDRVIKNRGDYVFEGWVVGIAHKRSGAVRYVVENGDGILHIFSALNLVSMDQAQQGQNGERPPYQLPKVSKL